MPKKPIYLDYASTTPTDPRVVRTMLPYFNKYYGNASSIYRLGQKSKEALNDARATAAKILNCQPEEIIFTGSGTESINLAIKGIISAQGREGQHLITSAIEHHAVLNACSRMNQWGNDLSIIPVDKDGIIRLPDLAKAIKKNTVLVSIMAANNEVGSLQPIREIGIYLTKLNQKRLKAKLPYIYFHTDACQATGAIELNVKKLHVDLLTVNGSKIYGPKGTGLLYIKKGTTITPLIDGGGQEKNLRSGTENVPGIVGLAKALEISEKARRQESRRLSQLRDWLIKEILGKIPKTRLNGHPSKRLPNNINVSILDLEGEALLLYLDELGISASTGSACTSDSLEPSHVIRALGAPYEAAHGSIRFTLGRQTTKKELKYLMSHLPKIVKRLRQTSPVNIDAKQLKKSIQKFPRKTLEISR